MKKLRLLEQARILPYPSRTQRTHTIVEAQETFATLFSRETPLTLVGRVLGIREHGKSFFVSFADATGTFQCYLTLDRLGEELFSLWKATLDIGDFCAFAGTVFETKKKEKTLLVKTVTLLAKSLRPIPSTYYGLEDPETRYRKRYLDLLVHSKKRELFVQKARFWHTVRRLLQEEGYLEVETPALELVPGGAEAEPFLTHHNALDQDYFLRISLELPLKRLLVAGYEKVFEVGRIFRNEGMSAEHLQEYTQMECYWAYADYSMLMDFLVDFYRAVIQETFGTLNVTSGGYQAEWGSEWKRYDYYEYFEKHVGISLAHAPLDALKKESKTLGLHVNPQAGRGRHIDALYKARVRPHLKDPGFLLDPPVDVEPLAKRTDYDSERVQRFQVVAYGTELGKGFSELNDPMDQRTRFEEQMRLRGSGDKAAQRIDEAYLEAMEYGMPPAAGFGMSERLFAVLANTSVREATLFPLVKELPHA